MSRLEHSALVLPTQPSLVVSRTAALEVVSIDADAVLKDACAVLQSQVPSALLHAIDAGAAVVVMSDQAFREIGWMSAVAARGHEVVDAELRAMLVADYLSRIPVVSLTDTNAAHPPSRQRAARSWLPEIADVIDPNDIAHVQLARLISATAVYSHDRHLRRPGHAPRTRDEYDERVQKLSVVAQHRETEEGAAILFAIAGVGTDDFVTWMATRLGVSRGLAWSAVAVGVMGVITWAGFSTERRARVARLLEVFVTRVSDAYLHTAQAEIALRDACLVTQKNANVFEVRVATYLVRQRSASMRRITDDLNLTTAEYDRLTTLLTSHPVFEPIGRWGWGVGSFQGGLETEPSSTWRPRRS